MDSSYSIASSGLVFRTDSSRHQLAPSKQVAIRFMTSAARKNYDNPGMSADNGYVRAFEGTIEEFCEFAIKTLSIQKTLLYFQNQALDDESVVFVEDVENSYDAQDLLEDLMQNRCFEEFEGHVILFCNGCLDVWPFEASDDHDGSCLL